MSTVVVISHLYCLIICLIVLGSCHVSDGFAGIARPRGERPEIPERVPLAACEQFADGKRDQA